MLRSLTDKISAQISRERLFTTVYDVAQFHRIQASTGFRAAANYCKDRLNAFGIEGEILSYPANSKARYLCSGGFQEWDIKSARCDLVEPQAITLADYLGDAISVIQRSFACDHSTPLEIVFMDKGINKAAYADIDLKGKLLFFHEDFNGFMWAVEEKGALGFLTDNVAVGETRSRADMYDIKKYTSFWYKGEDSTTKPFGFVLSPRMGDKLESICKKMAKDGKYPKATCHVDSSIYDGYLENVSAVLKGESSEEVILVAHLCHPRASANDNASGVACVIEALHTIKTMVEKGVLAPLKRTIRILLVPEFAGTFAYFDKLGDGKKNILAGLNLDMVGGRQDGTYGPLTLTSLPYSTPSFTADVSQLILDQLRKEVPSHEGSKVPMFNSTVVDFSGGSDHIILSDPTIDIPCQMLGQFPDLNYHTSGDTTQIIDPNILHKSASIAAVFAYALANLDESYLPEIYSAMCSNMTNRLSQKLDMASSGLLIGSAKEAFDHVSDFYVTGCDRILSFLPGCTSVESQKARLKTMANAFVSGYEAMGAKQCDWQWENPVYTRNFCGTIDRIGVFAQNDLQKQAIADFDAYCEKCKISGHSSVFTLVIYYMDGKRPMSEVARLVSLDTGCDNKEVMKNYADLLCALGLIKK